MQRKDFDVDTLIRLDECVVCASCTGLFAPDDDDIFVRERGEDGKEEHYVRSGCPHCEKRRPTVAPVSWSETDAKLSDINDSSPIQS